MMGEEREKFIDMLTGEEIDAPPYIAAMIARRRAEAVSPTPAAAAHAAPTPAGSGETDAERAALEWLDHECDSGIVHAAPLRAYLHAQRAAREAAERASANWQEDARRHAANESHWRAKADEARAALSAATAREARLRELCEESLAAHSTVFDFGRHTNVTWKDALSERDELRARLASLVAAPGGAPAPEGGTP